MAVSNVPVDENPDPLIGRTLEGYKFLGILGQGGFGAVYLAQHPRLDRQVAVKYIRLGDPEEYDEAEHEIKILTGLQHRNVVQIYDAFRYQDYQLIMMEFIRGGTLRGHVEKLGALELPVVLEAMSQVADALHYVHNRGVLHLDLKPANVLLEPQEEDPIPRFVLTDFGIARFVQPGKAVSVIGGTPAYMAPEQFGFGEENPDRRADIYQFGVILYELVVGALPFEGNSLVDFARKHAYEPPPRPTDKVKSISPALEEIILKALEKSPADRFQSAGEIGRALASLKMTLGPPAAGSGPERLAQQVRQQAAQMHTTSVRYIRQAQEKTAPLAGAMGDDATTRLAAGAATTPTRFSLMVRKPTGEQDAINFNKASIIVGRSKEVDLQLDQKTISRRHLQIDCEGPGKLFITDLESTHGTFLDNLPLPPNQRTPWLSEQTLRIESFMLRAGSVPIAAASGTPAATANLSLQSAEVKQLLDQLQAQVKQPRVSLSVSPEIVYVEMGRPQYIQVRAMPVDVSSARYELRVVPGPGIDARWYTISAPKTIEPGQTGTFDVAIAAPGMEVVGGQKYELILEVVSDKPGIPTSFQVVKVSVVPFMRFNIALEPGEVTHQRRRNARLIITNNGNYLERFSIRIQAPDRLKIRPQTPQVELPASQFKAVPLRFSPTRDAFKEDRLLFSISVDAQSGMSERVNGSYVLPRRRHIPRWLLLVAAIIIAVMINWLVFGLDPAYQWQYFISQVNSFRQTITGLLSGQGG